MSAMSSGLVANASVGAFTRPADTTAYASGDLVANSTTAGSVSPIKIKAGRGPKMGVVLTRVRIVKSGTSVTSASFRVHVYRSAPTVANGDNGAFSSSGAADYCGAFDVTSMRAFTDGAVGIGAPITGSAMLVAPTASASDLWCLLEARDAYTPANAETFQVIFEELQD